MHRILGVIALTLIIVGCASNSSPNGDLVIPMPPPVRYGPTNEVQWPTNDVFKPNTPPVPAKRRNTV
jgi:hypothetical protein